MERLILLVLSRSLQFPAEYEYNGLSLHLGTNLEIRDPAESRLVPTRNDIHQESLRHP